MPLLTVVVGVTDTMANLVIDALNADESETAEELMAKFDRLMVAKKRVGYQKTQIALSNALGYPPRLGLQFLESPFIVICPFCLGKTIVHA